ncbi:Hint domain-containing protein [Roseovarius aestuariivivens]
MAGRQPEHWRYHHLLFARHEILLSHGLASESLLVTP